jgi:hypothetical protein
MDETSRQAYSLLQALFGIRGRIVALRDVAAADPRASHVTAEVNFLHTPDWLIAEAWIDFQTPVSDGLCFYLPVEVENDKWVVKPSVLINRATESEQDTLRELPQYWCDTIPELIVAVEQDATDLERAYPEVMAAYETPHG